MHEIKNIYTCIHRDTNIFTLLSFIFPTRNQSDEGKAQPLFPKVPIFIMELVEKPQLGLGFKEADFTVFDPTHR